MAVLTTMMACMWPKGEREQRDGWQGTITSFPPSPSPNSNAVSEHLVPFPSVRSSQQHNTPPHSAPSLLPPSHPPPSCRPILHLLSSPLASKKHQPRSHLPSLCLPGPIPPSPFPAKCGTIHVAVLANRTTPDRLRARRRSWMELLPCVRAAWRGVVVARWPIVAVLGRLREGSWWMHG
ncbi:uncharacterized protein BKA78DRAFT_92387 [Phyllosticta capitalensis]|uniref:uncharacterized protein n=1 Tax=Phyllosticta capitalensis TaxID=121624 RepID=UPI003131183D